MTERTFTYTWTDAKRLTVLHALGFMLVKLETDRTPPAVTEAVLGLITELSTTPGKDSSPMKAPEVTWPTPAEVRGGTAYPSGTEAARAVLSPPAPNDYFQRDKKGNVLMSAPDGAELSRVKIISATKLSKTGKASFLQVIFAAGVTQDGATRPAGKANCFDDQLWNPIKNREGQVASLWIAESGNYLNIVGVRA